ncbi:TraB family protein, partial [Aphelenchoides avenae]
NAAPLKTSAMRRRLRSRDVLQTVAKSSRHSSSAEGAPEPFHTSTSSQKLNGSTDLRLNASRLEVLSFTLDPKFLPTNDDEDSYKEFIRQAQVLLIGTTHGDKGCAADVRRAIRRIRPDTVVVELCNNTMGNLYCDKSELHAAFEECHNVPGCRVVLGDRDMRITDKRAWNVIGAGEMCRIAKDMVWIMLADGRRLFSALSVLFFQYDMAKQRAAYDALDHIAAEVLPEWWKAVVTERDLYMTHVLHNELESLTKKKFLAAKAEGSSVCPEPLRLVAIVGMSHIDGIKANWDKRVGAEAIEELLTIPRDKWSKWIVVVAVVLYAIAVIAFNAYLRFF